MSTEEALVNSHSRMLASALTWPIEKSKLVYQGGGQIHQVMLKLPLLQHATGMLSSGLQRGGSAFLMFFLQSHIYQTTKGSTSSHVADQAVAGALSGVLSAPFHTFWELIKVRGTIMPCRGSYTTCLTPMIYRHAIFDATFFGVHSSLEGYTPSSGVRFAAAAAVSSFTNLIWDVWKTRQMQDYPVRISLRGVVVTMRWRSFVSNYLVKGTDLTANWFMVGCVKDFLFLNKELMAVDE
jgi:hypothetical protein